MAKPVRHTFVIGCIDFFLLNVALFSVHLIKRGNLELSTLYVDLFIVFYLAWMGVSFFMRKFKQMFGRTFCDCLVLIVKSNIAIVFLVSFSVVLWAHLSRASRLQTFGACGAFFLLELAGFSLCYVLGNGKFKNIQGVAKKEQAGSSAPYYPLVCIDAVLLI